MLRTRSLFTIGSLALMATTAACSGDDSSGTPSNDGGTGTDGTASTMDAGATGDGALLGDGATAEGGGPVDPTACTAYVARSQKCAADDASASAACASARQEQCAQPIGFWSTAYQAAYAKCTTPDLDCEADLDACIVTELNNANVAPSAVQVQLRDAFCNTLCPGATSADPEAGVSCSDSFYGLDVNVGTGYGYLLLQYNDSVAQEVLTGCDAKGIAAVQAQYDGGVPCAQAFSECAGGLVSNHTAFPEECSPPSLDDDGGTQDASDGAPPDAGTDATVAPDAAVDAGPADAANG